MPDHGKPRGFSQGPDISSIPPVVFPEQPQCADRSPIRALKAPVNRTHTLRETRKQRPHLREDLDRLRFSAALGKLR